MRWIPYLWMRIKMLFGRGKAGAHLDDELYFHIEQQVAENIAAGMSAGEARFAALRSFGNPALLREQTRETWGWIWLERFLRDLKFALRQLRKAPGFSLTVIAMLALGIGATAAMYTLVDRVLLPPLPYETPRQLLRIEVAGKKGVTNHNVPFLDLRQWSERSRTLKSIAYFGSNLSKVSYLEDNAGATQVDSPRISAKLLATLGIQPAIGRGFKAGPDLGSVSADDAKSILLSDTVWRTAYASDDNILGKTVKLNGESCTVIGVMPRGFTFPFGGAMPVVWKPLVLGDEDKVRAAHGTPSYQAIARLTPGISLKTAEAELSGIQADLASQYTQPYQREQANSVKLRRYGDSLFSGDVRKALLALFGASGVLWLIACVNVTSLMLARSSARQREIAVRGALGASRWQIAQQLLVEGLFLSLLASILGMGLAMLTLKLFEHGLTKQLPIHVSLTPSLSAIAVLACLTVLSALVSSVWPAISAARVSIEPSLRQGSPQSGAARVQHRMRAMLVVAQIAMSLTLLAGCGLLLRTIYSLRQVPLGFRTDHVIVANMTIPSYKFSGRNMITELYQPLLEKVEHLPGVQSASLMTEVPLGKTSQMEFTFAADGNSAADVRRREMRSQFRVVSPEMQSVFQFRILKGRFFNAGDTPGSPGVLVVNRAFAKEYTGQDDDPGKILGTPLMGDGKERKAIVVGVLDDQHQVSIAEQSKPEIEVCLPQLTTDSMFYRGAASVGMDLAVRTGRGPASIIPELRQLLRNASPELAGSSFSTMDQIVEDSYGNRQLAARLLEIFGGSALMLCVCGIYGLLAYLVTQRTRELGLRIALGAQRADVMGLVLRQAVWMLLTGSAIGLVLAYFSSQLLRSFLYGVEPHDAWTMAAVTLLLLACGLASAWLPARRAAAVDLMQALRTE